MSVQSLTRECRKDLENTIKEARRVAEDGARKAVAQLGVGEGDAPSHLTQGQRTLRNRLRAHGRQLGDRRMAKSGMQATARLVEECAYEHWHRMLFARFLAEASLLIEPHSDVAITLGEVRELAGELATDWLELASGYAERMLPQIFRKGDPVLELQLPPENRSELEDLLKDLSPDVFQADDSLGWVYQFWQSDKKDQIRRSETKITAEELPAVTQLFTEDYMVLFLLHNTLGAWWAGKVLGRQPGLATSAKNENELRAACRVGNVEWPYLRFVRDSDEFGSQGSWRPAAGTFEAWPEEAKALTVLDPFMGSGHFLVFALPLLVAFRMAEEDLCREAAVDAVLRENLFGLEIDPRCTQLAAFNLAFAAWRIAKYRPLPRLNLACSGLAIGVAKEEWMQLAGSAAELADRDAKRKFRIEEALLAPVVSERARNGLERLYDLFSKAPSLGSLISPRRVHADMLNAEFDELEPLLAPMFLAAGNEDVTEMAVAAQGMAKAAQLLARDYFLVVTNVPYLKRGNQEQELQLYCDSNFWKAKGNLACTAFARCVEACKEGGSSALVVINELLSLKGYEELRLQLLNGDTWNLISRLGARAFETIQGEVVNVCLVVLTNQRPLSVAKIATLDATPLTDPRTKAAWLRDGDIRRFGQAQQITNADSRIVLENISDAPLLSEYVQFGKGSTTGDSPHYHRYFWELPSIPMDAVPWLDDPEPGDLWSGRSLILIVPIGSGALAEERGCMIRGQSLWGRRGIAVSKMGSFSAIIYAGEVFDDNIGVLQTDDKLVLLAVLCYVESGQYARELRKIDQALKVTAATLTKVPFVLSEWAATALEKYPRGLGSPCSNRPTQWLFLGFPAQCEEPLQVAVARLIGYRWPRQTGSPFVDCPVVGQDGLEAHEDGDGIVCLKAVKGETSAEQRLHALLSQAFASAWSAAKLAALLADVGFAGRTLDDWLHDGFFQQHCELFFQRPFVWHVWDGRRDGFHALLSYHKLAASGGEGRRTLEKLIYSYLGDWIDKQRAEQSAGIEGADGRLGAAEHLRAELIRILKGDPPYDIFVRWKPLSRQPIGWEPDLDDGVRLNIRPFMIARAMGFRAANSCILRSTPKIKWDKDRGKERPRDKGEYPWFWSWDGFTEDFNGGSEPDQNRWNSLHYSHSMKQAARDRNAAESWRRP